MATYAVADIHGQLNTFFAGLKTILVFLSWIKVEV